MGMNEKLNLAKEMEDEVSGETYRNGSTKLSSIHYRTITSSRNYGGRILRKQHRQTLNRLQSPLFQNLIFREAF